MSIRDAYFAFVFKLRMKWQREGLDRDEALARARQDIDAMTNVELIEALANEEPTNDQ